MEEYTCPLVPGPTSIPEPVRKQYFRQFGSSDLEKPFFDLYKNVQHRLGKLMGCGRGGSSVVIMTGEGMLGLWAALNSTLRPGDKVVAIGSGVYGIGIGEMAAQRGVSVVSIDFPLGYSISNTADLEKIEHTIEREKPKMVTVVHCDTPTGMLNPVHEISKYCKKHDCLYFVDAVSSIGAMPIYMDDCNIDLMMCASQKVLSCTPDLAIIGVSKKAWKVIDELNYVGYDALKPWKDTSKEFPYTQNWHAIAALEASLKLLQDEEGIDKVHQRHKRAAQICRDRVKKMNLEFCNQREEDCSPTVTAIRVPEGVKWDDLDKKLRERGIVLGSNFGKLHGKVFRVGHMGSQANDHFVTTAMDALEQIICELRKK